MITCLELLDYSYSFNAWSRVAYVSSCAAGGCSCVGGRGDQSSGHSSPKCPPTGGHQLAASGLSVYMCSLIRLMSSVVKGVDNAMNLAYRTLFLAPFRNRATSSQKSGPPFDLIVIGCTSASASASGTPAPRSFQGLLPAAEDLAGE